jgi:excisionase family DNA binding protein
MARFEPVSPLGVGIRSARVDNQVQLPDDRLLLVREVAERLRICTATVYRMIARGQMPGVRFAGAFVRVRESDLRSIAAVTGEFGKPHLVKPNRSC